MKWSNPHMSTLGHKQTFAAQNRMSALTPKADIWWLFENFVCSSLQCRRHAEANGFGGLQIDHEFVLRRRLHRQVARFLALENTVDVIRHSPKRVNPIWPIRD